MTRRAIPVERQAVGDCAMRNEVAYGLPINHATAAAYNKPPAHKVALSSKAADRANMQAFRMPIR